MSNKDWTDRLPELLENFTEAEPAGLWDAVRGGIVPARRRVAAGWWYAGGALLAAAAVVAVVLLWPVRPSVDVSVVPGNVLLGQGSSLTEAEEALASSARLASQTPPSGAGSLPLQPRGAMAADASASPASGRTAQSAVADPSRQGLTQSGAVPSQQSGDSIQQGLTPSVEVDLPRDSVRTAGQEEAVKAEAEGVTWPEGAVREEMKKRRRRPATRVQVGMSTTGYFAQASSVRSGVGIPSSPGLRSGLATKSADFNAQTVFNPYVTSRNKPSTTEARHAQDMRISLALKVNLDYRWGIETGIVSSTISSSFLTTVGNTQSMQERSINYVGIPLYLCYNLLDWKKLGIYMSAGPMYEFSTGTNTSTTTSIGTSRTRNDDHGRYKDNKWSLNANAGMQLQVFKHGAIFLQPGFSYHFKDNSKLETFYTEHPAAFNITFGYRLLL
ncbi:MAG: outer membrane beta-barrel protein [Bacteroidales bacterium]|nr:outer membrane beta-barrel protein [Bacteroidales bacterium]